MNKTVKNNTNISEIVHVMTNQYINPIHYDKATGQVSYIPQNSSSIYTCYDYDLVSLKGFDHLRAVLSQVNEDIKKKTNKMLQ